jgi:hypothetical protein
MSKKVLDIENIKNELEGASLFFAQQPPSSKQKQDTPGSKKPLILQETRNETIKQKIESSKPKENPKRIDNVKTNERTLQRSNERSVEISKDQTMEPPDELTNVSLINRTKIRHTFDIYGDQLLSLREIAIEQEKMFGERVLLGDLVQQALDMLISKEKNK